MCCWTFLGLLVEHQATLIQVVLRLIPNLEAIAGLPHRNLMLDRNDLELDSKENLPRWVINSYLWYSCKLHLLHEIIFVVRLHQQMIAWKDHQRWVLNSRSKDSILKHKRRRYSSCSISWLKWNEKSFLPVQLDFLINNNNFQTLYLECSVCTCYLQSSTNHFSCSS